VCLASIAIVCAFSLLDDPFIWGYRYLVPTIGFEVILVVGSLNRWLEDSRWGNRGSLVLGTLILALATASSTLEVSRSSGFSGSFVRSPVRERDALRELIAFLDERGVRHVYACDGMLQWKLMFESRDRIKARWIFPTDRIPGYPADVDQAFREGQPVAIFGETSDLVHFQRAIAATGVEVEPIRVNDRYFVLLGPPRKLVGQIFQLNP
jgi:hypothetical protein